MKTQAKKNATKATKASKAVRQDRKPIKLSGRPLSLQEEVFAMLPAKAECPHCHKPRTKEEFGVRVVERDSRGQPKKVLRQSWCVHCRNGTYERKPTQKKSKRAPILRPPHREPTKTVVIARPGVHTVHNGHGNNLQYAGLERQVHVFRFATKRELREWMRERPAGRLAIEKPVVH